MSTNQTNKSVLVVDNDPPARQVVVRALKSKGHQVRTVSSGPEALRAAAHQHFDLVFLDVTMPGMSGLEVLGHMTRRHPGIAVVILSANNDILTRKAANRFQTCAYLTKPFRSDQVTNIADTVLVGA